MFSKTKTFYPDIKMPLPSPMAQTDRQTDKTTRWAFTAYEDQWSLFEDIKKYPDIAEWGWQTEECPETKRKHYQGYLRTTRQFRLSGIVKMLPRVHVEPARNWSALLSYCRKVDTAVEGTQVRQNNPTEYWSMDRCLLEVAKHLDGFEPTIDMKDIYESQYWYAVRAILTKEPFRVSSYAQPMMYKLWRNTSEVWKTMAAHSITEQPSNGSSPSSISLCSICNEFTHNCECSD